MSSLSRLHLDRPANARDFIHTHARLKLLLMAHDPAAPGRLGRIVARAGLDDLDHSWRQYVDGVRATLALPLSRGGHVNALQHALGYFRGVATDSERLAMRQAIADYAAGRASLDSPRCLVRQAAAAHAISYLVEQLYFEMPEVRDVD